MKRFILFSFLVACSDPGASTCKPHTCEDLSLGSAQVCGKLSDGCGKEVDCGPCAMDHGGGGSGGGKAAASATASASASSAPAASASAAPCASGSASAVTSSKPSDQVCEDLKFDK